jgi:hypothetical protein
MKLHGLLNKLQGLFASFPYHGTTGEIGHIRAKARATLFDDHQEFHASFYVRLTKPPKALELFG